MKKKMKTQKEIQQKEPKKKDNIKTTTKALILAIIVLGFASINFNKPEEEYNFVNVTDSQDFSGGSLISHDSLLGNKSYKLGSAIAVGVFSLDGEKQYVLNSEKKWPVASLTKLMTALVVSDGLPDSKRVVIKKDHVDLTDGAAYGSVIVDEEYTVSDLKKALLLVSSNVAAEALAHEYGRGKFIELMNEYASQIGMENTYFADPTGLSVRNQSTIGDMAKLVLFIYKNEPEIFKITKQANGIIYDWRTGSIRSLSNINKFVDRSDFIGGKTGTTPESVGNLISVFSTGSLDGRIIVVLGSEDRFEETKNLLNKWR